MTAHTASSAPPSPILIPITLSEPSHLLTGRPVDAADPNRHAKGRPCSRWGASTTFSSPRPTESHDQKLGGYRLTWSGRRSDSDTGVNVAVRVQSPKWVDAEQALWRRPTRSLPCVATQNRRSDCLLPKGRCPPCHPFGGQDIVIVTDAVVVKGTDRNRASRSGNRPVRCVTHRVSP